MEENKVVITKEGLEILEKEYDDLVNVQRQSVKEELAAARAQGDLSENADYDAARDRQARIEARIREIEEMKKHIVIIDEKAKGKKKVVSLGSTVRFVSLETGEEEEYRIVGTTEADPFEGKISNETEVAKAVLSHKVNDEVIVFTAKPYKVKILEIK